MSWIEPDINPKGPQSPPDWLDDSDYEDEDFDE